MDKPLLADGSVVGDYSLLFKYWEKARKLRGEEAARGAVLGGEDFRYLENLIGRVKRLSDLLDVLTEYFMERVDPEAARQAYVEAYGVEIDAYEAARRVARILAGWLVEAAKSTGMLRLRGAWEH